MTQDYKEKYPIGSQWKCRDGSRAVVVENGCELIAWNDDRDGTFGYDGSRCLATEHSNSDGAKDLITEWQEPQTIEGWINVYDGEKKYMGGVYRSRELALKEIYRNYMSGYRSTIRITYNEQEGVTAAVEE